MKNNKNNNNNNHNNKNNKISHIKDIQKKLWDAANSLRGNLSSEEYQHIIIGILTLKFISNTTKFAKRQLEKEGIYDWETISEEDLYYIYEGFKVPKKSEWSYIKKFASSSEIGQVIDEAFFLLEKNNKVLKGIFNKNYNREGLDQIKLGEVVKIFSDVEFSEDRKEDVIGRIYEFFLGKFFKDRGKAGGEFYTPKSIVKLMVNLLLLNSVKDGCKIYDPACGTGGILIQAKKYIFKNDGDLTKTHFFGQEYNNITWKIAKLNFVLHGLEVIDGFGNCVLGDYAADTFTNDLHKNKIFDFVVANPPFNLKKWSQEKLIDDPRWKWGLPPKGNANFAWLSHMLSKLNETGKAAIVLANGSLSSNQKNEKEIRKNFLLQNKVDAIIQLPDKLFFTTGIPACIWIFNNNKKTDKVLMVSASDLEGNMISKKLRELKDEDIKKITDIFEKHENGESINEKGFAKTVTKEEIEENDLSFVPGQYVEILEEEIDVEATKEEIKKSFDELQELFKEFNELQPKVEKSINKILEEKNNKNKDNE